MISRAEPSVRLPLLRAGDRQLVKELPDTLNIKTSLGQYSFLDTFKQDQNTSLGLTPGTYLIRAEFFDGDSVIASGITAIDVVDRPKAKWVMVDGSPLRLERQLNFKTK